MPESQTQPRSDLSTRDRILAAAGMEFVSHGFAGARMQRIAEGCGANKAMIYYYFGSKENLYRLVIGDVFSRIFRNIEGIISHKAPLEEKIRNLAELYVKIYSENTGFLRLMMSEIAVGGEVLSGVLEELEGRIRDFDFPGALNETLRQGQRRGEVRKVDPRHTLMSLVGMSSAFILFRPVARVVLSLDEREAERFAKERAGHIADLLLHGILKAEKGGDR